VLFEEMEVWVPKKKESLLPDWVKKIPGASKRDDNTSGTSGDVTSDKNEAPHKRPMIPTYLSTHPATAERIKMLEQDKE
jgi:Zn-dependent protease with chaperone function